MFYSEINSHQVETLMMKKKKGEYIRSACFLILRVTDSPAICSRCIASLSGFPLRLTPLMAKTRSPIWMAPVLQGTQRYQTRPDRTSRGKAVGLPEPGLRQKQRGCLLQEETRQPLFTVSFVL